MPKKKTKIELFEELAGIDENGCSRWVSVDEFVGKYQGLQLLNGAGWDGQETMELLGKSTLLNEINLLRLETKPMQ